MANTITNLLPDMYRALDVVSRELIGFIPAVTRDSGTAMAAVGQNVRVPVTPAASVADITPAATGPSPAAQTVSNVNITISKQRSATFYWEGEEEKGLTNAGTMSDIRAGQFAQAFRALANEVEADLATTYKSASRAHGTAATTPFGSNIGDAADVLRILDDNGAPSGDRHIVLGTAAKVNLQKLTQLTNANQAGTAAAREQGALLDLFGAMIHTSAKVVSHTKGTGAGYLVDNVAGLVAGTTSVATDTGTGTILAGDIVTFAADTDDKYVVNTALAGGVFAIGAPGIRGATVPNNDPITVGASYVANMAFSRSAIVLATRLPASPSGGDDADEVAVVQDPRTGLAFDVRLYRQYHRVSWEIGLAWGFKNIKPEHTVILLG